MFIIIIPVDGFLGGVDFLCVICVEWLVELLGFLLLDLDAW